MEANPRPSVYLMEKAKALLNAITFFASHVKNEERMLVFLSQVDFWEWEIDNLLNSFYTFEDRKELWEDADAVQQQLNRMGISIRPKKMHSLKIDRRWKKWYLGREREVVAPMTILKEVIERWNKILQVCEEKYLSKYSEVAAEMGANVLPNLAKFKRQEIGLEKDD